MPAEESHEKEFIIPTRYKARISSQLSWPTGALEFTEAFAEAPQVRELQLIFTQHYPTPHQGKWPASFSVAEVCFTNGRPRLLNSSEWVIRVYPVPRSMRAEIREKLEFRGFKVLGKWLIDRARFSGHAGDLRFSCVWNSELKTMTFESHDYVLPEVSVKKGRGKE